MVGWLLPVALLPKTITSALFENFAQAAFPILLIFGLIALNLKPALIDDLLPERRTMKLWGIFIVSQLVLFAWYSLKYGESIHTYGLIHGWITFVQFIMAIFFAYVIQKVFIRDADNVVTFLVSLVISLSVYVVFVLVPQLVVSFHGPLTGWTNGLAHLFERHWDDRSWYDAGSYVATKHRLNGFEPEAPFLVMLLGLVFSPVLVAILQEPIQHFKNGKWLKVLVWGLLCALCVVFLMARSTSGYIMLALVGVFMILFAPKQTRKWFILGGIVFILVMGIAYMTVPVIHHMFEKWLFDKKGTDNRLGGTIGLALTFLHHPLVGVGYGNEGYFIEQYLPAWSKHNSEYLNFYSKTSYPILNDMLGWLARFGLIALLIGGWLLGNLISKAGHVYHSLRGVRDVDAIVYRIVLRAFFIMVPMALIMASITQINAFSWPMLLMYFFYWRTIQLATQLQMDVAKTK